MKRSVKDICRDFDRNTLYVLRQDLDLLEQLRKAYPTHTLVLAGKPVWPGEPKGRLRLTHCRDLGPPAAARAYLHLFEQLTNDWGAYASERNRFLVAIDLNINMHLQAAAGK